VRTLIMACAMLIAGPAAAVAQQRRNRGGPLTRALTTLAALAAATALTACVTPHAGDDDIQACGDAFISTTPSGEQVLRVSQGAVVQVEPHLDEQRSCRRSERPTQRRGRHGPH